MNTQGLYRLSTGLFNLYQEKFREYEAGRKDGQFTDWEFDQLVRRAATWTNIILREQFEQMTWNDQVEFYHLSKQYLYIDSEFVYGLLTPEQKISLVFYQ